VVGEPDRPPLIVLAVVLRVEIGTGFGVFAAYADVESVADAELGGKGAREQGGARSQGGKAINNDKTP
jgi:hypothetical protein